MYTLLGSLITYHCCFFLFFLFDSSELILIHNKDSFVSEKLNTMLQVFHLLKMQ